MIDEYISDPTSSTDDDWPVATRPDAIPSPARKPVQAEFTSNEPTTPSPSFAATIGAVAGHFMSGVVVATITVSTRPTEAVASAARPACTARSDVASPAAARER